MPVLKSQAYPDTLKAFDGIDLIEDTPAPAELDDIVADWNAAWDKAVDACAAVSVLP